MINPDGISYINIAKHYANLDFKNAINGYWSPFISIAIAPFVNFFDLPQNSFWLINYLSGVCLIIVFLKFLNQLKQNYFLNAIYVLLVIPFVCYCQYFVVTPDFISIFVIFLFLFYINKLNLNSNKSILILAAIIALSYFIKYYNFISLLTIAIISILFKTNALKLKLFSIVKLSLISFLIISLWVGLIYKKYNLFTLTTSAQYNFNLKGDKSNGHTMFLLGIKKPFNHTKSLWEDPSYTPIPNWNPLESENSFVHFKNNFNTQWQVFFENLVVKNYKILIAFLIVLSVFAFIAKSFKNIKNELLIITLYPVLYFVSIFEERYYWAFILLIIFTVYKMIYLINEKRIIFYVLSIAIIVTIYDNLSRQNMHHKNELNLSDKGIFEISKLDNFPLKESNFYANNCALIYLGFNLSFYTNSTFYNCGNYLNNPYKNEVFYFISLKNEVDSNNYKPVWQRNDLDWAIFKQNKTLIKN